MALVAGTILAAGYAFWYGPLAILAYGAAPLAILAVLVWALRVGREGLGVVSDEVSGASVVGWWIFGCTVGGTVGGLGYVAQFAGELIFFGGLLGIAQWIVLRRYVRYAGFWIVASFFGWIVGQVLLISVEGAFPGLVEATHEMTRDDVLAYAVFDPIVWAVYGVAQGIALLAILQRHALIWIVPWVLASASGGVVEAAAIYLELNALLGVWGGGYASVISVAVYQGAICALYGLPTGLVLYGVLSRAVAAE